MTATGTQRNGMQRKLDISLRSRSSKLLIQQFANKVVGQEKATQVLVDLYEAYQAGFGDSTHPAGSCLFLGPTGSGKTHIVETFAEALFGNRRACLRIDCAEYIHSHEISKLIGSPAGYLGHRETPAALNQKRLDKYHTESLKMSILLLDEIEKASDAFWDLLLGVLDKASLTLGTNEVVDFSKTIVIMTSNLGSREMANHGLGFAEPTDIQDDLRLEQIALSAAKSKFRPEFLNRLGGVVVFKTLTQQQIAQILDIELQNLSDRLFIASSPLYPVAVDPSDAEAVIRQAKLVLDGPRCPRFTLAVSPKAKQVLLTEGFDKQYGARHLKRAITRLLEQPLAKLINSHEIVAGDTVVVDDSGIDTFDFYAIPKEKQ